LEEIIAVLLSSPAIRGLIEEIALKLFADIFHRREIDPAFKAASDSAFGLLSAAKTDEEKTHALAEIQRLMSS